MAPEHANSPLHERLAAALDQAGERTGASLVSFVRATNPNDAELLAEVERLMGGPAPGLLDRADDPAGIGAAARAAAERAIGGDAGAAIERVGRYRIVREIGRGGMGVVYEAEQADPKRRVALKVIRSMTPDGAMRLRREAAAMGRLRHPGIAQIYEAGHDPGVGPYIVMEFVDGQGLLEYAAANCPSIGERVALLAAVCDAVHAAHQRGIIHRDLKPSNVVVERLPDGAAAPKVLDFGVAQLSDPDAAGPTAALTGGIDAARIVGTLGYMSPEAIDPSLAPDGIDIRTDVYALGVLLYEMIGGRPPIDVSSAPLTEAARRILTTEPARLERLAPGARGDLSIIAAAALEKDRARRYESAAALAADLRRLLAHEPIAARPPTVMYQLRKLAGRHRGLTAGLAAGAASLLIGAAAAAMFAISEKQQRVRAEAALELAQRRVYAASIAAAARAAVQSDSAGARAALAQAPEPLRGWEWSYLSAKAFGARSEAPRAAGSAIPIGATREGKVIVVFATSLAVVDPASWTTITSIPIDPPPRQFAFDPERGLVAHWTAGALRVLDAGALQELWSQPDVARIERGAFSAGGEIVAHTRGGLSTAFFDARTGAPRGEFDAVSPPGAGAFCGRDAGVWYEVGFGQRLTARRRAAGETVWVSELAGVWRSVPGVEAPVLVESQGIQVLDPATGRASRQVRAEGVMAVAGSPVDSLLAISERRGAISIWSNATNERLSVLLGHSRGSEAIFLPDGTMVSGSLEGSMHLWDPCAAPERSIAPGPERLSTARLAVSEGRVIALGWGSVLGWDLGTGAPAYSTYAGRTFGTPLVVVSPAADRAFCSGFREGPFTVRVGTGQIVERLPSLAGSWSRGEWSDEGLLLVSDDGSAAWADPATGGVTHLELPPLRALAKGRSSGFLVGASDGRLARWSRETGLQPMGPPRALACSVIAPGPGGSLIAADDAGDIVVRDADGRERLTASVPGAVSALALTPDERRLAVFTPGALHIVDMRTGDVVLTLEGPASTTEAMFTPDGRTLLAAGNPALTVHTVDADDSARSWCIAADGARRAAMAYRAAPRQTYEDVRERVRTDAALLPDVRQAALHAVDVWRSPVPVLNSECWAVALSPAAPRDEAERAVRAMRQVCSEHPDWHLQNTLGFCLYRAGMYAEALQAFEECERRSAVDDPTDAAGLALTLWRLGREEEARRWLELSRRRAASRTEPLVQEAERIVGSP